MTELQKQQTDEDGNPITGEKPVFHIEHSGRACPTCGHAIERIESCEECSHLGCKHCLWYDGGVIDAYWCSYDTCFSKYVGRAIQERDDLRKVIRQLLADLEEAVHWLGLEPLQVQHHLLTAYGRCRNWQAGQGQPEAGKDAPACPEENAE